MKWNVGIVGATGAVGEELLKLLPERRFPVGDLRLFASERSAGRVMHALGAPRTVETPSAERFAGLDVVFFSAGAGTSREIAPLAVKAGVRVVDNSSAFRMDPKVPLVIPEINGDEVTTETPLVAVPNCTTIVLLMAVAPLRKLGKIERVIVSTYQAASGAGARAMRELIEQTADVLDGKEPVAKVFKYPIAFNLFSHDSAMGENGYNGEENKVAAECCKILGDPELKVSPTCIRVPVPRAHSESAYVEFDREISEDEARAILANAPGVIVLDDRAANRFPMPRDADGRDEVFVGRIRRDLHNSKALDLFICGDQIRKGAALNSIQIAERMREVAGL